MNELKEKEIKEKKGSGVLIALVLLVIVLVGGFLLLNRDVEDVNDVNDEKVAQTALISPENSVGELLENVKDRNWEYIDENTGLEDAIDFESWNEIDTVDVKEVRYEDTGVALARVDFNFLHANGEGTYPLTLFFVLESVDDQWTINGVEHGLERWNSIE